MNKNFQCAILVCIQSGITILFLMIVQIRFSFAQSQFIKSVGSIHTDVGMSCQPTSDHGTILVAESATTGMDLHCGLVKADINGIVQWIKLFQIGQWSMPSQVLQSKDEGYIIYGTATDTSFLNNNEKFLFLHKTDLNGDRHWDLKFSLSANDLSQNLIHRKAGGYLAVSVADYNIGNYPKIALTCIDDMGNIVWSKKYSVPYGITPQKIVELPNSNICIVSYYSGFPADPFNNIAVTVTDPSGSVIWSKSYGTYYDDEPSAVATNLSGEIFVTGRSYFLNREWDSFLLRIDSSGNILNKRFYDAGTDMGEIVRTMVVKDDGSCKLVGDMGTFNERDICFLNIDANGSVISSKRYPFSPLFTNYPYEMFATSDGGYFFTGEVRFPTNLRGAVMAKTDGDGNTYCYNTNTFFTEFNDTISINSMSLSTTITNAYTRVDTSIVPNNIFTSNTVCSGIPTDIFTVENNEELFRVISANPFDEYISIDLKEKLNSLILYDVNGKLLLELNDVAEGRIEVNVRSLSKGIYFLKGISERSMYVERVLKGE